MIDALMKKIDEMNNPTVVGLDPTLEMMPAGLKAETYEKYGKTPKAVANMFVKFNKEIIDSVYDIVPAVKPQIAMYEQFGIPGLTAYQETVRYCKKKGLVVIGDVKRGDIGSTSESYAIAHLGSIDVGGEKIKVFDEDFATVNPYLGTDGIKPFTDVCAEEGKGIFVLVKTSNPSSGEFQDRESDGKPIYQYVGEMVDKWGEDLVGKCGYSSVGAVVGATYPEIGKIMRKVMPKTYILVPGYGAQGGKGKDLVHFFNEDGLGAIINSSRGIIAAYKNESYASFGEEGYADAARQAVIDMKMDIEEAF